MKFHVLTLFPEMIESGLGNSITGRAIRQNLISLNTVNIRDYTLDKHKRVDDYTYGGGAGMLMQPQPVYDAWKSVMDQAAPSQKVRTIYVTPQGLPFTQRMAESFAGSDELIFICGHYEGIDERVLEETVTDYVSIGDYVLTGGELAAMVMIDCISRLVPGVLHNETSADTESFHGSLLEYPQYSRPEEWHGKRVPEVLLSGNQKEIDAWRLEQSVERTRQRRPDLYREYEKLRNAGKILLKEKIRNMDMISLIDSGRAQILSEAGDGILLKSMNQPVYYINNPKEDPSLIQTLLTQLDDEKESCRIVFHQDPAESSLLPQHMRENIREISQAVLTRKEKLPVRGLYRPDGKPSKEGLTIRSAGSSEAAAYMQAENLPWNLPSEAFFACFHDQTAGICGIDPDGRISLLYTSPEYRGQKAGAALLTCVCNELLLRGFTPYLTCPADSRSILTLAVKSGMYQAKGSLWELEIKK